MGETKLNQVPNFLTASTPALLRELMFKNNLEKQSFIKYQDISQLADGSFICWYYDEINLEKLAIAARGSKK
jgi:hypothetical protein